MISSRAENPAYKHEDLSISNPEELDLVKFEAGVKSHEEALREAFAHGIKTGDNLLVKNSMDMIKEVGVAEYLTRSGAKEKTTEENRDEGNQERIHLNDYIKEEAAKLAEGNQKERVRIEKRIGHLIEKWGDVTRAITQAKYEKEAEKKGCSVIPSIQCQGLVERIIRNPGDIVGSIPDRL